MEGWAALQSLMVPSQYWCPYQNILADVPQMGGEFSLGPECWAMAIHHHCHCGYQGPTWLAPSVLRPSMQWSQVISWLKWGEWLWSVFRLQQMDTKAIQPVLWGWYRASMKTGLRIHTGALEGLTQSTHLCHQHSWVPDYEFLPFTDGL